MLFISIGLLSLRINPRLASLASRLVSPNRDHDEEPEDEEALFAELEAEIENDDSSAMREHALAVLRQESAERLLRAMFWKC